MQQQESKARGCRKFVVTTRATDRQHSWPIAPDLRGRDFAPGSPNLRHASDITCIATAEAWLHLAATRHRCRVSGAPRATGFRGNVIPGRPRGIP